MSQCTYNTNEVFEACKPSKRKRWEPKRVKKFTKKHFDAANNYLFGTGNAKSSMLWFRMHEDDRKHAMILAGNRALLQLAKMGVNTKV